MICLMLLVALEPALAADWKVRVDDGRKEVFSDTVTDASEFVGAFKWHGSIMMIMGRQVKDNEDRFVVRAIAADGLHGREVVAAYVTLGEGSAEVRLESTEGLVFTIAVGP